MINLPTTLLPESPPPQDGRRHHLLPLSIWTGVWALFFVRFFLGQERLPPGDFLGQFHAFARFQAAEMLAGRLPVWSPFNYGGFPFAADTQAAVFYLPRWLTIALSGSEPLPLYALQLEALIHVWLAGVLTYLLAFALTRQRVAALVAALAFALGGYLTAYPVLQLAILETVAWLPLVLLLLRAAVAARRPLPWLLAAGLVLALAFTAGHPQTFLHVSYLAAAYYFFLGWRARWSWRWLLGGGAFILAVVVGVTAVAWLPQLRLTLLSTRAEVDYRFVSGGTSLLNFLQLVLPGLTTLWSPEYVGLPVLLLVLFALYARRALPAQIGGKLPGPRAEILFWAVAGLVAAWTALGDKGLLFQLAYYLAPGFSLFRGQERLLGITSLSLALLSAQGLALWLRLRADARRHYLRPALLTAGLIFLLGTSYLLLLPGIPLETHASLWVRQFLLLLIAGFLLYRGGRSRRVLPLLVLTLTLDLCISSYGSLDRRPGSPASYWPEPAWLQQLQAELAEQGPTRIDSAGRFQANVGQIYRLEDVYGISPLKPSFLEALDGLPQARRWQLLNVGYVLGEAAPPVPATPVASVDQTLIPGWPVAGTLYRLQDTLPRAWLVYRARPVADASEALLTLRDPAFSPAEEVVLHPPLPPLADLPAASGDPVVKTTRLRANALQVQVETEAPGLLVVSEWAYPGWQAFIDGERVPLYPADYALQAVRVPAGEHIVRFRFLPPELLVGAVLSLLALVAFPLLVWRWHPEVRPGLRGDLRLPALPLPRLSWPAALLRHWHVVLLLLFLLAFGLRLANLGVQDLRGDEGFSYLYASRPLPEVVPALIGDGDPHPPLHYLLLGGWMRLAGDSEFALRYLTALGSVLLLPLLFRLGRRLRGVAGGLLLVALVSLSQSQIWLGQDARNQYALVLFFSLLATLLLDRAVNGGGRRWWAGYALAAALVMYSHYYGLFVLLAHGLYLAARPGWRRLGRAWVGAGLAAFLLFVPWLIAGFSGWEDQLHEPGWAELTRYLVAAGRELTVGPAFPEGPGRWIAAAAGLLALLGFASLWRKRRPCALLLGGWLLLTLWGIFLIRLRRATFNYFYVSVAAPAWWALIVVGLSALWSKRGRHRPAGYLVLLALFTLATASLFSLHRYYGDPVSHGRLRGYRPLAAHVAARLEPGDLLVHHFPDPALPYYFRNVPIARQLEPARAGLTPAQIEAELAALADRYDRLWFVPAHRSVWDPGDVVYNWLEYHALLEEEQQYTNLTLQAYRPLAEADQILTPLDTSLAELNFRLEGFYITVNGRPAEPVDGTLFLPAGADVEVSLVWQAEGPIARGYTVFVHLLDAEGRLLAQHDGVPVFGTRPTSLWQPGEVVLDKHRLHLPASTQGEGGRLTVGIYDSETLVRQPFASGSETQTLGAVRILPAE